MYYLKKESCQREDTAARQLFSEATLKGNGILTIRWEVDLAFTGQKVVAFYIEQERQLIAALAAEEIEPWSDLPFDDAVAEHGSLGSVCQRYPKGQELTSLRFEFRSKFFGGDLYVGRLLIRTFVAVVAVTDHCGFPREFKIYK